jgi:hypothetical protein
MSQVRQTSTETNRRFGSIKTRFVKSNNDRHHAFVKGADPILERAARHVSGEKVSKASTLITLAPRESSEHHSATTDHATTVKCDEVKPTCHRCLKAGLLCEGYGNFVTVQPGHIVTRPDGPHIITTKQSFVFYRGMGPLAGLSARDSQLFDFACSDTIIAFNRCTWSSLWSSTIPAIAQSEPAVLEALLALAAAHRRFNCAYKPKEPQNELFVVQELTHSSRAMRSMHKGLSPGGNMSPQIALLICLLLIYSNITCERYGDMLTHLHHGRNILKMLQSQRNPGRNPTLLHIPPAIQGLEDDLVYHFGRLDIQAVHWTERDAEFMLLSESTEGPLEPTQPAWVIPDVFNDMHDAARHILFIIHERTGLPLSESDNNREPRYEQHQTKILAHLQHWKRAAERSPFYIRPGDESFRGSEGEIRFTLMRMHHSWTSLEVAMWRHPDGEMGYDKHINLFADIVSLAGNLLRALPIIGLDMAALQPALKSALRCRHPVLRRKAVQVLVDAEQLGLWNTAEDIAHANEFIRYEEAAAGYVHHAPKTATIESISKVALDMLIPSHARLANSSARFTDKFRNSIQVSMDRFDPLNELDPEERHIETIVPRDPESLTPETPVHDDGRDKQWRQLQFVTSAA